MISLIFDIMTSFLPCPDGAQETRPPERSHVYLLLRACFRFPRRGASLLESPASGLLRRYLFFLDSLGCRLGNLDSNF